VQLFIEAACEVLVSSCIACIVHISFEYKRYDEGIIHLTNIIESNNAGIMSCIIKIDWGVTTSLIDNSTGRVLFRICMV
jgi:hypothetical protein